MIHRLLICIALCLSFQGITAQPYHTEVFEYPELLGTTITAMAKDGSQGIWLATFKGLLHKNLLSRELTFYPLDTSYWAEVSHVILIDHRPWVIAGGRVFRLETSQWKLIAGTGSAASFNEEVLSIVEGANGEVWLGGKSRIAQVTNDSIIIHSPFNQWLRSEALVFNNSRLYANRGKGIIYFENNTWHQFIEYPDSLSFLGRGKKFLVTSHTSLWVQSLRRLFSYGIQWSEIYPEGVIRHFASDTSAFWVIGESNISSYNLLSYGFSGIDTLIRLGKGEFTPTSFLTGSQGELFFGGAFQNYPALLILNTSRKSKPYAELFANSLQVGFSASGQHFMQYQTLQDPQNPLGWFSPKGQNTSLFSSASLWAQADINNQKHISVSTSHRKGEDFMSGPVSNLYNRDYLMKYNRVWKVTRPEIEKHIRSVFTSGYQIPEAILSWPAHGRPGTGEADYLAPFVDLNGNDRYEPELGDHPKIKGDEAVYLIYNDQRSLHDITRSSGLSLEIHAMAYCYSEINKHLDSTIFVSYKFYNRSGETLKNFKPGLWADFEIGYANDDLVGCDSALGLVYAYNKDNSDSSGFEENPPAAGFFPLSEKLAGNINYNQQNPFAAPTEPGSMFDFLQMMDMRWLDSSRIYVENPSGILSGQNGDGQVFNSTGFTPTNYHYNDQVNWYQSPDNFVNTFSLAIFETHTLANDESYCLDLAFTTAHSPSGGHLESLSKLKIRTQYLRDFYSKQAQNCLPPVNSLEEKSGTELAIYPNPASNFLLLLIPENTTLLQTEVFSALGQKVLNFNRERLLDIRSLSPGGYFMRCSTNQGFKSFTFIKQ